HLELSTVRQLRAELKSAVALATLAPDLELQVEIAILLLAAQERVRFPPRWRRADDGPVLHAPESFQSLPAAQVLAVEEGAGRCRSWSGLGRRNAGDGLAVLLDLHRAPLGRLHFRHRAVLVLDAD